MRRRSIRARVVFPQPDSPTIPSVSPRSTEKLTSFTAIVRPEAAANAPAEAW